MERRIETLEDLNEMANGFARARVLQAAAYLDVFTHLAGGARTIEYLAGKTGADPDRLERLLIACCALGLLRREGETFANTPVADEYLVRGREFYQGNIIRHGIQSWERWNDVLRGLRPGKAGDEWDEHDDFILGMHNRAVTGMASELASMLDLRGRRRLIDVGGGPGTFSVHLCRANPALHATIWDLPATIAIARRLIAEQEDVRDRLDFVEGDWNADELGQGYDCLLMSNVLHGHGSKPDVKLARARRALEPGGLIILQDFILNDTRDGPLPAALFNIYIGAFTFSGLIQMLQAAGFTDARVVPAPSERPNGVVTAVRK
jgi:ubiquinone/menaquinone biosynthesis C-methylase UbiE